MEILSFTFGVLLTTVLLLVIAVILGAMKVNKQGKQIKYLEQSITDIERNLLQNISNNRSEIHRRIDHVEIEMPRAINDQIANSVTQCNSYTDKRIDKLIDTYFKVETTKEQTKKLIKG
jgi:predicted PurR-regulated permease PerM